jgi:hypothetical protein
VSDTERPAFVDPNADYVRCYLCGQTIHDMSRVDGIDISEPDHYYPDMRPVCEGHDTGGDDDE